MIVPIIALSSQNQAVDLIISVTMAKSKPYKPNAHAVLVLSMYTAVQKAVLQQWRQQLPSKSLTISKHYQHNHSGPEKGSSAVLLDSSSTTSPTCSAPSSSLRSFGNSLPLPFSSGLPAAAPQMTLQGDWVAAQHSLEVPRWGKSGWRRGGWPHWPGGRCR